MGTPMEKAISVDSMSNPQTMQYFVAFAERFK
jgi:hypothetical protein